MVAESPSDILWLSLPPPTGLHHLMGVGAQGNPEGSSQSKVRQLDGPELVDEQVLRLQISVDDPMTVTEVQSLQQLGEVALWERPEEEPLNRGGWQGWGCGLALSFPWAP